MKRLLIACMTVMALGGAARAEGLVDRVSSWSWPPDTAPGRLKTIRTPTTLRETSYAEALGTRLGTTAVLDGKVAQRFHSGHDPDREYSAWGIRVTLGDGTVVERVFLDSEQAAFDYVLYAADLTRESWEVDPVTGQEIAVAHDVIVEARGRQVVVARGSGFKDADRASKLLDAAWSGLGTPRSRPSVSATLPYEGGRMFLTRRGDRILDREMAETFDELRKLQLVGEGVTELAFSHFRLAIIHGMSGEIQSRQNGMTTFVIAASEEDLRQLELQLERALNVGAAPPSKHKAARTPDRPTSGKASGAAGKLGSLFD